MMLRAETYTDDECRVVFLQSASEPHEILVAPAYLVLTRVELAPCGLEGEDPSEYQDTVKKGITLTVLAPKCDTDLRPLRMERLFSQKEQEM